MYGDLGDGALDVAQIVERQFNACRPQVLVNADAGTAVGSADLDAIAGDLDRGIEAVGSRAGS